MLDDDEQCDAYFEEKPEEVDDVFNYQKALLEYGMVLQICRMLLVKFHVIDTINIFY